MSAPVRVLLVDDDPIVRSGVAFMLASTPDLVAVGEAGDGDEVLSAVAELTPDVVLMDLKMPRTDGITATRAIASRPSAPFVIVLTTWDVDEAVIGALDAGASGFLLKSASPAEIFSAIRCVMVGDAVLSKASMRALVGRLRADATAETRRRAVDAVAALSPRERDVAVEVGRGSTNAEIASTLFLSPATVKDHLASAQLKLGVRNRTGVAVTAERAGLLADVALRV